MLSSKWVRAVIAMGLSFQIGCSSEESTSSSQGGDGGAGGQDQGGGGADLGGGGAGGGDSSAKPVCLTKPQATGTPLARADVGAAFSPDGQTVVIFGGDTATVVCGEIPAREHVGDTWILDVACGEWTELTIDGPDARSRHAMVADSARAQALLFGGRSREGDSGPYTLYDDVWAFDFGAQAWQRLETTGTGPSPRHNAGVAVIGRELFVFGGSTSTSGLEFAPTNELFALDLETLEWSELAVGASAPPARLFHSLAADGEALYVAGGGDEQAFTGPFLKDAWTYDVATDSWSELDASFGDVIDPGRIKAGLLAEPRPEGTRLHAFAGHDDGALGNRNDVSVLSVSEGSWAPRSVGDTLDNEPNGACDFPADFTALDLESPERRSGFGFAARPDGRAFVIFGGDTDCGRASDAWWYDAETGLWEAIRSTPVGQSCGRFSEECSGLCG